MSGISLFGLTPREKEEKKKRRDENTRSLNEAKAVNVFPEQMNIEMKEWNPETLKFDKGGRRTRRRKSRKSKRSKKSRKSRKHRK
jgi:hypothetical protein